MRRKSKRMTVYNRLVSYRMIHTYLDHSETARGNTGQRHLLHLLSDSASVTSNAQLASMFCYCHERVLSRSSLHLHMIYRGLSV